MNTHHFLIILALVSTLISIGCQPEEQYDACEDFHWSYESITGPSEWATCAVDCDGGAQSPIDIYAAIEEVSLSVLRLAYQEAPIDLHNNGHTVQFDYATGSNLILNGREFELIQFHFHAHSEHQIEGEYFPLEAHLVHQNPARGDLAVIGILFKEGQENSFLANFSHELPTEEGEQITSTQSINVANLFPEDPSYFTYDGSLTTPPCSEVVSWVVMKEIIEVSSEQIQQFEAAMPENYRPLQALNGRQIRSY